MADMNKAEKLALARKKLKEYQQKTKEPSSYSNKENAKRNPRSNGPRNEQNIVFDSGPVSLIQADNSNEVCAHSQSSSSVKSSTSLISLTGEVDLIGETMVKDSAQEPENPSLRLTDTSQLNVNNTKNSAVQSGQASFPQFTMMNNQPFEIENENHFDILGKPTPASYFFNMQGNTSKEVSNFLQHESNIINRIQTSTDSNDNNSEHFESSQQNSTAQLFSNTSQLLPEFDIVSVTPENDVLVTEKVNSRDEMSLTVSDEQSESKNRSSMESLRQLSMQLNGLIEEPSSTTGMNGSTELEKRNQELAALLAAEKQRNDQLHLQLKEHQVRITQMQQDMEHLQSDCETKLMRETGSLQEQLQVHVQTVGILVGEKTELQAALSKSQQTAKQKAAEVEELEGRFKTFKQRNSELEKTVSASNDTINRLEASSKKLQIEVNKLEMEKKAMKERLSESEFYCNEIKEKLSGKETLITTLRQEIEAKKSQLELAELRLQQLNAPESSDLNSQLINLHEENVSLGKKVVELQQIIKSVAAERDQASQQYQNYVQQLNAQLENLATKCKSLTAENEQLVSREQSLVRHVSDLEKQLHNQKKVEPAPRAQDVQALQEMESRISVLENDKQELATLLDAQKQETDKLEELIVEKNCKLEDLESLVERLQHDQPDKTLLLAAMESDKVAASRAVGQNQKLKEQLEELQDGFIKMSNNKLELTEKLDYEQHVNRELSDKLSQKETDINMIREKLQERETTIETLQEMLREKSSQIMQQNQVEDMKQHYRAHGDFPDLLRQELKQAKEQIEALTCENQKLQSTIKQYENLKLVSDDKVRISPEEGTPVSVEQSSEEESTARDDLCSNNIESSMSQELNTANDDDVQQYESMQQAMEKLQERFARTMKEVADLSDEKQRLEHLVLQLQSETETIGEYVALYQVQRSVLRQRAQEKDEELANLAKDREDLKGKLNVLNDLVLHLLKEKGLSENQLYGNVKAFVGLTNGEIETIEVPKEAKEDESPLSPEVEVHKNEEETENLPPTTTTTTTTDHMNTVNKIMALLSEIKTSNLMEPQNSENFHPCPWCSGQLITV